MGIFDVVALTFQVQVRLQPAWILGGVAMLGFLWAFVRLVRFKTGG